MNSETRRGVENIEEEKIGEQLIDELKNALESTDKEKVLSALKKIGETIHSVWGSDMPISTSFDELRKKYVLLLSTGTSGTRLSINNEGDLIFPNVNLNHKNKGKTLAVAFEEVFRDLAKNIGDEKKPYYIIKITGK